MTGSATRSPTADASTKCLYVGPGDYGSATVAVWGGKGAALARLARLGLPVPPLAAIPPGVPEADLPAAVAGALDALEAPAFVAVRSSGVQEDGAAHAFAGAFETFLFVPLDRVVERVRAVRASGSGERVEAYRAAHGLDDAGPPAVVIQAMVDARVAGVAFSADPVTGDDVAVVSAVRGLGSALVDGREEGDTVRVASDGTVAERIDGEQLSADQPAPGGGVRQVAITETGPVLTDTEAGRVAALARRAADVLGGPQDVEWALADGALWLLQSRPITTLGGTLRLWDNANIVESYAGVTTPLTYSFARRAYAAVYREFCRLLAVAEGRIEAEADTFEQMIGLVRGRIYYNLGSWYRVLALLPGYRLNAGLMEGMMGVKEGIPAALRPEPSATGRVRDALGLIRSVLGLIVAHVRLPRMRDRFYGRVDDALARHGAETNSLDLDALVEAYTALDARLLRQWDAPLVNDFFAMIWFGLANRAADSWIGGGALGGLLAGDGDVVSAEPARHIDQIAEAVRSHPGLVARFADDEPKSVRLGLAAHPAIEAEVDAYLDRFGDRCLEELKLESLTLADDPTPMFRAVAARARRAPMGSSAAADQRADAEARVADALRGHPLRRLAFDILLRNARARVRDRENLRFERTRVFGRARRLFVAMGERLVEAGRLDGARDVFWLELDEMIGLARGTATTTDVRPLVDARRAEFDGHREAAPPPDRFTTRGPVALAPLVASRAEVLPEVGGDRRTGLGCCAGVVEGPVRVVRDPRGVELEPGTILVAERTDPGWVLLFPSCAGLVVERGSLLSHSAIVARELGIPAAVSVPGVTGWLRDGDFVRLDGAVGTVDRIETSANGLHGDGATPHDVAEAGGVGGG